jgi:[ribosomal protein S5]-alanine N-acetyltransferase
MIVQYQASEFAAYDGRWPTAPEEIKGITAWFAENDGFMAVCLKDSDQFIGFVANNLEGDKGVYNLGYILNSDYHGRGYATEACRAVLAYAFEHLGAVRIVTGTAQANRASCRLLEKLGFVVTSEGTGSLQNDSDGKPIVFERYTYELTSEHWHTLTGC